MKVLIFTQFYPPEMEPSGFMFSSLSKHLALSDSVKSVDVICGFPNFPDGKFIDRKWYSFFRTKKEGKLNIHNVVVIPSDNKSNLKRILNYTSYMFSSVLRGWVAKSPDVVIATSPPIFAALAGLIVAKLKRSKFVLDVRDIWPESAVQMGSIKNTLIIKLLERLELLLYRNSNLITVATPGMVNLVRSKLKNNDVKVVYIPCGVIIPKQGDRIKSGESPFLPEDNEKSRILYAGLHGHAQNLTTIVDAAKKLQYRNDIVFYFIGAGPDKERVMSYAATNEVDNIKFLQPVPRDKIRKYFVYSTCAIVPLQDLPIFKNVYPSKTFELMSYGVPTIVGVGGEIANLIIKSKAGQAVTPECSSEYVNAILNYVDNPSYRDIVSVSAIKTSKEQFDYDVVNAHFESLLTELNNV